MVMRKRGKMSRHRGSHTHGYGAMKKHRGSGNKGGKGRAGSGKRADSKKPSIWKNKDYFGKYGFVNVTRNEQKTLNIRDIEERLDRYIAEQKITVAKNIYTVDLSSWGVDKLLGTGKATHSFMITVAAASEQAIEKIEAAGGKVMLAEATTEAAADNADNAETEE
ncbi:uL15 family ribosomal protein [Candidatus Woesearchaeota archaeon]|nr:uL15 family ribosomal protein [Candidatus Woesearchaeota archaeon]